MCREGAETRCLRRSDLITSLAESLPPATIRLGCQILSVTQVPLTSYSIIQLQNGSSIKAKVLFHYSIYLPFCFIICRTYPMLHSYCGVMLEIIFLSYNYSTINTCISNFFKGLTLQRPSKLSRVLKRLPQPQSLKTLNFILRTSNLMQFTQAIRIWR